ncbi:hypothetical protein KFE25_010988 [Diacronema lutheri]|uniref:Rab-GAP TBC domain-containing protein n=1 Tax=Diacronema lutheri TaxID=2081491 RepID=A0A8J6C464_DIALT|nr:hypothetical protein KFE25_010988 [Diacronema lutheri]
MGLQCGTNRRAAKCGERLQAMEGSGSDTSRPASPTPSSEGSALSDRTAAARLAALRAHPALDRFGFAVLRAPAAAAAAVAGFGAVVRGEAHARSSADARRENAELHKWLKMLGPSWPAWCKGPRRLLLKRRVRRGVPSAVRAHVWDLLAGVPALHPTLPPYEELVAACPAEVREEIELDVRRTFPEHALFAAGELEPGARVRGAPDGAELLGRLLAALGGYDAEVGYCQGLNYVGGLLLLFMPEDRALCLLVALFTNCGLRASYLPGLPGLRASIDAFDELLAASLPALHAHLERELVEPSSYCTRWFMTLFIGCLPFEGCLRALDSIALDRDAKVLFRLALAVLALHERRLLALRGEALLAGLRAAPAECANVDALFERAFALNVRRRVLGGRALGRPDASAGGGGVAGGVGAK